LELGNSLKIEKVRSGSREKKSDTIPREMLLHLFLNKKKIRTVSCSPNALIELAAGYAVSNGYVGDYHDIGTIELCTDELDGKDEIENTPDWITADTVTTENIRAGYISSGCGDIDEVGEAKLPRQLKPDIKVKEDVILELNRKNIAGQEHKKALGGLHSAALFDKEGSLILVREDIGRHNCLDKVIGHMLMKNTDISDKILFTSGRISLDLVLKAVRVSVPVVVTNSSVTHSAVMMARRLGLAVIGYARGKRFNIYSHPERII